MSQLQTEIAIASIKAKYKYPEDPKIAELWQAFFDKTIFMSAAWTTTQEWADMIDYYKEHKPEAWAFCLLKFTEKYWHPFMLDVWNVLFNDKNQLLRAEGYVSPVLFRDVILITTAERIESGEDEVK